MSAFAGQIALVTGAAAPGGIGAAIAADLAAGGAHVIVTDLTAPLDVAQALGAPARAEALDVTDASAVAGIFARLAEDHGRLDILVNNAATLVGSAPSMETTPAQWQTSLEVNLLAPMRLTQAAIPLMRAGAADGSSISARPAPWGQSRDLGPIRR